jgi:hypothetical protein
MLNRAVSCCCCFIRWLASAALAGPPHVSFGVTHPQEFRSRLTLIWVFVGQALAKAQSVIAKLARENAALKQGLSSSQHQSGKGGGGSARARSASPPPRRSFGAASGFDSPQPQVSCNPSHALPTLSQCETHPMVGVFADPDMIKDTEPQAMNSDPWLAADDGLYSVATTSIPLLPLSPPSYLIFRMQSMMGSFASMMGFSPPPSSPPARGAASVSPIKSTVRYSHLSPSAPRRQDYVRSRITPGEKKSRKALRPV